MYEERVLVIDDDADVAAFVKTVAESCGFEAHAVEDHRDFSRRIRELEPDVVVTDLQMPDVDGIEVLRTLASENSTAKVVLMSGVDSRVIATARRLGSSLGLNVVGVFTKPVSVKVLRELFGEAIAGTRAPGPDEIHRAAQAGELLLHYQPKVCLSGPDAGRVTGAEALVRWQHPRLGLLQPSAFVELAESCGAIASLTDFVLAESLAQLARWRDEGLDLAVAVNLSPLVVGDLDLPDRILALTREAGVPSHKLLLEITESGAMGDSANVLDILTRLRLKDFDLSIDDFGTGYSSLVQLYRMPFSELKIDKSFVMSLHENPEAETIVRTLVDLAHNLSLTVCAEGIEDRGSWDFLVGLGCEKAQGYYMSRPLAPDAFSAWAAEWRLPDEPAPLTEVRPFASFFG